MNVNVQLPKIITARDYHDFDDMEYTFKILFPNIQVDEVGFDAPFYIGVIYDKNSKPSREDIIKLLDEQDYSIDEDDWAYV